MAWYDVTYKCGHRERVQLYGKMDKREDYIKWCRDNKLCPDCAREAANKAREVEIKRFADIAEANNYPALTGSDKQVKWALALRQDYIDRYNNQLSRIYKYKLSHIDESNDCDVLADIFAKLASQKITDHTDAKYWIDNRDNNDEIIEQIRIDSIKICKSQV